MANELRTMETLNDSVMVYLEYESRGGEPTLVVWEKSLEEGQYHQVAEINLAVGYSVQMVLNKVLGGQDTE